MISIFKFFVAKVLSMILKKDSIFLIGERKSEARDNGYAFFKYVRDKHSDENFFYVIDRKSDDYEKVNKLGNLIEYDSFKHYLYLCRAKVLICSHLGSCVPDKVICWKAQEKGIINPIKVFIQHGITISDNKVLKHENSNMDYFVCGGKNEYDYIKNNFGYKKENVKYLGFCRFDNLYDFKLKKQILIMPTWRSEFGVSWNDGGELFTKSKYYNVFNSLINNKSLDKLLTETGYKLIFYPHYEMQGYLDLFKSKSKHIIIADKETYDVQQLLKESKLLITDYSSVAFDFAYMKKQILYYQFDQEEYYEKHYPRGYFDYESNGFGKIIYSEDELIKKVNQCISNDTLKKIFENRIDEFFMLRDRANSKRHYEFIKNL